MDGGVATLSVARRNSEFAKQRIYAVYCNDLAWYSVFQRSPASQITSRYIKLGLFTSNNKSSDHLSHQSASFAR